MSDPYRMNPLNQFQAELRLVVKQAEERAAALKPKLAAAQPDDVPGLLHDHRVEVAGDIADAMDRLETGLGTRWMQAMFAELDLTDLEQWVTR